MAALRLRRAAKYHHLIAFTEPNSKCPLNVRSDFSKVENEIRFETVYYTISLLLQRQEILLYNKKIINRQCNALVSRILMRGGNDKYIIARPLIV